MEELKRRKEQLELEMQVAKLEKEKARRMMFNFLPWKLTVPLAVFGLFLITIGLSGGPGRGWPFFVVLGIVSMLPLLFKTFSRS